MALASVPNRYVIRELAADVVGHCLNRHHNYHLMKAPQLISVAVLADAPVWSPGNLFIFITRKSMVWV